MFSNKGNCPKQITVSILEISKNWVDKNWLQDDIENIVSALINLGEGTTKKLPPPYDCCAKTGFTDRLTVNLNLIRMRKPLI